MKYFTDKYFIYFEVISPSKHFYKIKCCDVRNHFVGFHMKLTVILSSLKYMPECQNVRKGWVAS